MSLVDKVERFGNKVSQFINICKSSLIVIIASLTVVFSICYFNCVNCSVITLTHNSVIFYFCCSDSTIQSTPNSFDPYQQTGVLSRLKTAALIRQESNDCMNILDDAKSTLMLVYYFTLCWFNERYNTLSRIVCPNSRVGEVGRTPANTDIRSVRFAEKDMALLNGSKLSRADYQRIIGEKGTKKWTTKYQSAGTSSTTGEGTGHISSTDTDANKSATTERSTNGTKSNRYESKFFKNHPEQVFIIAPADHLYGERFRENVLSFSRIRTNNVF